MEDMVEFIEKVSGISGGDSRELTIEERDLLARTYQKVIGSRCASWRIISSIEESHDQVAAAIRNYRGKIETELSNILEDILSVPGDSNVMFYLKGRDAATKFNNVTTRIEQQARCRSVIRDLVYAAKPTSETICCENSCMVIFKLLSEEVFNFSRGEINQQKIKYLKSEFQLILDLCFEVLSKSIRDEVIQTTLSTLYGFLSWIPQGYVFASDWHKTLLKLFPLPPHRNLILQCLIKVSQVASLQVGEFYNLQYDKMFQIFIRQLQTILPSKQIPGVYASGYKEGQDFIQCLAIYLTSTFKSPHHMRELESGEENISALVIGFDYLINISYVGDKEIFKLCLDYWSSFVSDLFDEAPNNSTTTAMPPQMPMLTDGLRQLYGALLSKLRLLMICRMAKPEEVLLVVDESGNLIREISKDNDVLLQFKTMRETLIYLSRLDPNDTENQMLEKLSNQMHCEDWSWNNLNTLCWAIGSVSGSMAEEQESSFLETVIWDLIDLIEIKEGVDNNAVITSNIIYLIGQYPRYLGTHPKFLKATRIKLIEFMNGTHLGVQDMACDTFLKIAQKFKCKFVTVQVGEEKSCVSEILSSLATTVKNLEPHQIHIFYESVGTIIQAEPDVQKRDAYLKRLMQLTNQKWAEIMGLTSQNVDLLKDEDVIRTVLDILQINTGVAVALGAYFLPQMSLIFLDLLNLYRVYSDLISSSIVEDGPYASKTPFVKLLRSVKRETLKLIETFLDKAEDQPDIGTQLIPPMMDLVLGDYARNSPDARESEVLSLFATIINKYKGAMVDDLPQIFETISQCTLEMITKNYEDYPEHGLKFFSLLRAVTTHYFPVLAQLSPQQLKLVMDSITWAFRHLERNIAETGLNLLLEMLKNFQNSELCNQFYRTYFLDVENEIFLVLTDTFHTPGFKLHVSVLQHLFCLAECGKLTESLWDESTVHYPSNAIFVRDYTEKLLGASFPNMTASEVTQFVCGLFEKRLDLAKFGDHIRDFLLQSKDFSV